MRKLIEKYYPDGKTALNLGVIVSKCIDIANEMYGTRIRLYKSEYRVLILHDINAVSAQLIQILDVICQTNRDAEVHIDVDENNNNVTVTFVCDGVCNGMVLEFELYKGVPSAVISDKDAEAVLEIIIRQTFEKAAKIRRSKEANE